MWAPVKQIFRSNLTYGIGVFKSIDAGKTWTHIGLKDSRHISRIAIDPQNPQRVLVAAMGSAYPAGPGAGVFSPLTAVQIGGRRFTKIPTLAPLTCRSIVATPQTVFASLVRDRRPPWSTYAPSTSGGSIFKSTDGGATWNPITGGGLPSGEIGRVSLSPSLVEPAANAFMPSLTPKKTKTADCIVRTMPVRPGKRPALILASAAEAGTLARLWWAPKNPDVVYTPNVSIYRSTDGGKNFEAIKALRAAMTITHFDRSRDSYAHDFR